MRKYFNYFLGAALMAGFASCNDGEEPGKTQGFGDEQVYVTFKVDANGSRSATEGDGTSDATPDVEVGADAENAITTCQVVLKNDKGELAFATEVSKAQTDVYVASFNSTDLVGGTVYKVYVVCNGPTQATINPDATYGTLTSGDLTTTIAKANNFLMTNADTDAEITYTLPLDLRPYNVKTNPLNIGMYNVERAVARFDYASAKAENRYGSLDNVLNIQLTDIALVNMSNDFYLWKRVSADGTVAGAIRGGKETQNNYVVDFDAAAKANWKTSLPAFLYPLANTAGYAWTSLASLSTADNYAGDYNVWTYATENAIPAPVENQVNGISTGVVFKATLTAAETAPQTVKDAMAAKETIYVFNNVCYGSWANVEATANAAANADAYALKAAVNKAVAGGSTDQAKKDAGFYAYKPTAAGAYECLYYYWNRHNDNGNNREMGTMEFAVVRNNVYKLKVTEIMKYGVPTDTPPTPEIPDETNEYFCKVVVKVLPWAVRINNIEF